MSLRTDATELLAAAAVLASLAAAVAAPLLFEEARQRAHAAETPTVTLTALMDQGIWTDREVGAASAWRDDFPPARPSLRLGETVRLRLASADVVHSFALPALGIDPVEVYPGKAVEILVTPREAGVFEYYCTKVCGPAHFAMRGFLTVLPADGEERPPVPRRPGAAYWRAPPPPAGAGTLELGAWLYRRRGCVTCHGEAGAGGVPNPNSMNPEVPALAGLDRRSFLFTAEDAAAFVSLLRSRPDLDAVAAAPEIPLFPVVRRQYLATRALVAGGRRSVRLDAAGPRPALDMPAWGDRLTDREIDAILSYLLTLNGRTGDGAPPATDSPKGDLS